MADENQLPWYADALIKNEQGQPMVDSQGNYYAEGPLLNNAQNRMNDLVLQGKEPPADYDYDLPRNVKVLEENELPPRLTPTDKYPAPVTSHEPAPEPAPEHPFIHPTTPRLPEGSYQEAEFTGHGLPPIANLPGKSGPAIG